jgi:hypothetical protein
MGEYERIVGEGGNKSQRFRRAELTGFPSRIRRHIVPCDAPSNVNGARDRYVGLHAIGKSLRDQYDSLAAPVPLPLAALVKQLDEARQ